MKRQEMEHFDPDFDTFEDEELRLEVLQKASEENIDLYTQVVTLAPLYLPLPEEHNSPTAAIAREIFFIEKQEAAMKYRVGEARYFASIGQLGKGRPDLEYLHVKKPSSPNHFRTIEATTASLAWRLMEDTAARHTLVFGGPGPDKKPRFLEEKYDPKTHTDLINMHTRTVQKGDPVLIAAPEIGYNSRRQGYIELFPPVYAPPDRNEDISYLTYMMIFQLSAEMLFENGYPIPRPSRPHRPHTLPPWTH